MCIKVLPEILFYEASDRVFMFFDVLQDSRKLLEKCLFLYKKVPNKRFVTCSGFPFWLIIFVIYRSSRLVDVSKHIDYCIT